MIDKPQPTQPARGRLKIFLGYAAGVGKTYAMLDAARQRRAAGVDLVVGWVDAHGDSDTAALLDGLEIIPPHASKPPGMTLGEMDVDAVLARRPQIVLVDELAHTNAPGARHTKRWQDVEELLAAGIDVYTTLNVQHIESLNDVVAQITGVVVPETIPDQVVDEANSIELVDLPTEELLRRLDEDKIHIPAHLASVRQKFFKQGNLTALRELALRRAAAQVDEQMRAYMQTRAIPGPWPAGERVMVCISPHPLSERLVRTGRRLARHLDAEWFAVYVEAPGRSAQRESEFDRVAHSLHLAESLGAKALTLPGDSVAKAILDYARTHNITKIIIGKPLQSRWAELFHGSVVDWLIRHSGNIDVYVISSADTQPSPQRPSALRMPWVRYLEAIAWVAGTTVWSSLIDHFVSPVNLVMFYLLVVVITATRLGQGPSIMAAVLGVLAFNFFFTEPRLTFVVENAEYLLTFLGLLIVGVVIANLTARVREHAEAAQRRAVQTAALYDFSRDLSVAVDETTIIQALVSHVSNMFDCEAGVFVRENSVVNATNLSPGFELDEKQLETVDWVLDHGLPAGHGTDTLSTARGRFIPLKTPQRVVGVLGLQRMTSSTELAPDQRRLLEAFANQSALALEAVHLAAEATQAELLRETEKLQTALLNSISHDLRTPLVSITGALSSLCEDGDLLGRAAQRDLLDGALGEANRLNRLVGNLLDMTRLEAGAIKLNREPGEVEDIIGVALTQMRDRLEGRAVAVNIPPDLPLISVDFVLIVQVCVNLLDNAAKYSPPDAPIEIRAWREGDYAAISIADRGIGIPPEELPHIFDKFYRVRRSDSISGVGLGLSICKGIVEAHEGHIEAEPRIEGGTVFTVFCGLHMI